MEYGIGIQNRYAFLDEEGTDGGADPFAQLAAAQNAVNHGGKPVGKTPVANVGSVRPGTQKSVSTGQQNSTLSESKANVAANQKDSGRRNDNRSRPGGDRNQRPGNNNPRSGDQENRTQRSPRQPNNSAPFAPRTFEGNVDGTQTGGDLKDGSGREFSKERRDRNGFRGQGGRGGRPGGAPGQGRMKRDFNRHSGSDKTGIKPTEKREGAGAHNWGKPLDDFATGAEEELVNGDQVAAETTRTGVDGEGEAPVDAGEKTEGEDGAPKSDEPAVKTLDEYKREREEKRLHAQFNTRKANEGEDKTKWKKTFVLKKKALPEEEEVEYEEIEVEEDPNKRRGRQVLDIEVNFRPSDDGREVVRRGRGGPGGDRRDRVPRGPRSEGGRPSAGGEAGGQPAGNNNNQAGGQTRNFRGSGPQGPRPSGNRGGRGGRGFQATPKFDDLNDFPSL